MSAAETPAHIMLQLRKRITQTRVRHVLHKSNNHQRYS